nr:MAG: major capsid protein [Microvirus sp.]
MSNKNVFNTVALIKPKKAKFDLSHERKMSIPFGALIPTLVQEVLPNDSFKVDAKILTRFQALLAPQMHRVNVFTHYYFVPNRILSRSWTRFITYQGNRPQDSKQQSILPYFLLQDGRTQFVNGAVGNALKDGSLLDYLGFPTAPNDVTLSAGGAWYEGLQIPALLPLAYQRVWNDFYRDENFTQPLFSTDNTGPFDQISGSYYFDNITRFGLNTMPNPETLDSTTLSSTNFRELTTLRWRAWEKDYLTSALPEANQGHGDPRVPVKVPAGALGNTTAVGTPTPAAAQTFGKTAGIQYPGSSGNPSDGGSFTLSALRVAAALKRWLENTARGGARYGEHLWNHWMARYDDTRAMTAEYLGGGMQPVVISEVVTTAPASSTQTGVPAGYLAGHGIGYGNSNSFTRKFNEHGIVLGITSVLPRTAYLYSMPRAFMRQEPLDFAFPEFAQLGEQPVLGAEVFFKMSITVNSASVPTYNNTPPQQLYTGVVTRYPMGQLGGVSSYYGFDLQNDNPEASVTGSIGNVWGYQSRYAEYKYQPDTVHGLFRNNLAFWHYGRILPVGSLLNNGFVTSNPRLDGFAVLPNNGGSGQYNQHPILLQVYNRVSVLRSLPYYNTPSLW